ncbi:lysylphosphatidylglycerol synthase transmembrane domain-containing protein [Pedobacter polysacchareus]|uniref:lysylphosphatidylglycerol synthase transmembrane domain-containing protein n=1 Tax=Pedobacter polysacchareus TaxID=2861973 RepID=UPI001C99AF14|nr:lysylphosphatidylglycerol synthase transmembrane domain-containing protein [Pedobacter polysacchareus]
MTTDKKSRLFSFPRITFYLIAITAFYFGIRYVGKFHDVSALIVQINPFWLALALGFQVLTYAANAIILSVLLNGEGKILRSTLFEISLVTLFVNQALPTGGLSGNGYLFNQLVKRKVAISKVYNLLLTQTICYYLAVILMLSISYLWYLNYVTINNHLINYTVIVGYLYFIGLGVFIILLSTKSSVRFLKKKLIKFPFFRKYLKKNQIPYLPDDQPGLFRSLLNHKRTSLIVMLIHVLIILLDICTVYSILHGFHLDLPISKISFVVILSQIIAALPISPGALIAYESAMTYFLTKLGIPIHAALIVTLLFRFLTFWLPIPVGMLLYSKLSKAKHAPNLNHDQA